MSTIVASPAPCEVAGYPLVDSPRLPPPDEIYGLPWRSVFKIRNTIALRTCEKYDRRIPEEEFLSAGNEAIVKAIEDFDPTGTAAFSSFLWIVIQRSMRAVLEHEWQGWIHRTYRSTQASDGTRIHRRVSQTYTPPALVDIEDVTLSHLNPYEAAVLLMEIVAFVQGHTRPLNASCFVAWLRGYTPTDLIHVHGWPHPSYAMNRIRKVCAQVSTWVHEETFSDDVEPVASLAAAD